MSRLLDCRRFIRELSAPYSVVTYGYIETCPVEHSKEETVKLLLY